MKTCLTNDELHTVVLGFINSVCLHDVCDIECQKRRLTSHPCSVVRISHPSISWKTDRAALRRRRRDAHQKFPLIPCRVDPNKLQKKEDLVCWTLFGGIFGETY